MNDCVLSLITDSFRGLSAVFVAFPHVFLKNVFHSENLAAYVLRATVDPRHGRIFLLLSTVVHFNLQLPCTNWIYMGHKLCVYFCNYPGFEKSKCVSIVPTTFCLGQRKFTTLSSEFFRAFIWFSRWPLALRVSVLVHKSSVFLCFFHYNWNFAHHILMESWIVHEFCDCNCKHAAGFWPK